VGGNSSHLTLSFGRGSKKGKEKQNMQKGMRNFLPFLFVFALFASSSKRACRAEQLPFICGYIMMWR